jgi:hypothetical protein
VWSRRGDGVQLESRFSLLVSYRPLGRANFGVGARQFVGSRAVPLPASQPILAQLLRTLKSHPGVVVRFEGHVNATCGLECRGATGKPCKAARKVGSDMCARCPGGAYGLSKARAEAIKSFVAVWKFTSLREASMAGRPKFDFHTGLLPSAASTWTASTPWASRARGA